MAIGQWQNKLFFIVIHHFSLGKAAMNESGAIVNCAITVSPALTGAQLCYQNASIFLRFPKIYFKCATNFQRPHLNWLPNGGWGTCIFF